MLKLILFNSQWSFIFKLTLLKTFNIRSRILYFAFWNICWKVWAIQTGFIWHYMILKRAGCDSLRSLKKYQEQLKKSPLSAFWNKPRCPINWLFRWLSVRKPVTLLTKLCRDICQAYWFKDSSRYGRNNLIFAISETIRNFKKFC